MIASIDFGQVNAIANVALVFVTVASILAIVVQIVLNRRRDTHSIFQASELHSGTEFPKIHATSGVPTLQQLTQGIQIDPKDQYRIRLIYKLGLDQFNHYMNNRDGVLADARNAMEELESQICKSEVACAENIGIALSAASEDDRQDAEMQYETLIPRAQVYAQHKRREVETLRTIARDMEKDVPRTDFTCVKSLIESGKLSLDSVLSELPIQWQDIRTTNEHVPRRRPVAKPPPREYIGTYFLKWDNTYLFDKHAELNGKWILSDKYRLIVPYQRENEFTYSQGLAFFQTRKREYIAFVDKGLSSEWITEYWRRDGFRDQQYILSREGQLPEQLHRAYRRNQRTIFLWTGAGIIAAIDVVMIAIIFI